MNNTQIISTLGPSSKDIAVLEKMILSGMNIARLNFSHGTHDTHMQHINNIRHLNATLNRDIKILQDLEGYRIRVGLFKGPRKKMPLTNGSIVKLINADQTDQLDTIPYDYEGYMADLQPGSEIFMDDGNIALAVKSYDKDCINAEVIVGGILKENKGINIPDIDLKFEGMTEQDKNDLIFGVENKVDMIAQSFVQTKDDILAVREFINFRDYNCPIIAKIENRRGIENLDEILEVADGIMIARGDMGVSLPIYEVPMIQKMIINKCKNHRCFAITATQMLESMTHNIRPTRAEVSDVANAIIDGTDYVMLSGETAAGQYPVQAIQMMASIISFTEKSLKQN